MNRHQHHGAPVEQRPVRHRSADLTGREEQVVAGVVAGLSNDQIGRRLGISRWTVVNHLRHVMWKWDCHTRVEIAVRQLRAEQSGEGARA